MFHNIASKQTDFIKSKYIPRGINLDDPRTMKHESIVKLFEHIAAREVSHSVQDAFGFKIYCQAINRVLYFHPATPVPTPVQMTI